MSQANELLKSVAGNSRLVNPDIEPHIVIDDYRYITVPDELKRIAVQYDHDIETVTFDCPRYWDGHDMSQMQVYINYARPDGSLGSYLAQDITVDGENDTIMHFTWTVSGHVTEIKGKMAFLVCVKKADNEGSLVNHWNSELCEDCYISEGLETEETIIEANPDIFQQLIDLMVTTDANTKEYMEAAKHSAEVSKAYAIGSADMLWELNCVSEDINAVCYSEERNRFVAVGHKASYYSEDGHVWTAGSGIESVMNDVIYNSRIHMFVTVGNNAAYYSEDGVTWTAGNNVDGILYSVTNRGERVVAVGPNGDVLYTNNGKSWHEGYDLGRTTDPKDITKNGSYLYIIGDDGVYCAKQPTDIPTVATLTADGDTFKNLRAGCVANDMFVVVSENAAYYYALTDDTTVIPDGYMQKGSGIKDLGEKDLAYKQALAYGDGKFVTETNNIVYISTDGMTWTEELTFNDHLTSICYAGNRFVAAGEKGIYCTVDGSAKSFAESAANSAAEAKGYLGGLGDEADRAAASAEEAKTYSENAATSEANAKTSETNAKASEDAVAELEGNAQLYSHQASESARQASESAANAFAAETNARASENIASGKAEEAKASEEAAAASAAEAKAYVEALGGEVIKATDAAEQAAEVAEQAAKSASEAQSTVDTLNQALEHVEELTEEANTSATTATTKAEEAATSAANAKASEEQAKQLEENAMTYKSQALTYCEQADSFKQSAETAATNAAASAEAAATSEANAKTSEENAKTYEQNAKLYGDTVIASAEAAEQAASEAAESLSQTTKIAERVPLSVDAAGMSASNAKTSEDNAAASATAAATSAEQARNHYDNTVTAKSQTLTYCEAADRFKQSAEAAAEAAATSETNTKTSETNSKASETAAKTSETNASKSATDAAASAEAAATSEANAKTSETNAAESATNASTSASNAKTSETNASKSATNAKTSEENAKTSETNAAESAEHAEQSATNAEQAARVAEASKESAGTFAQAAEQSATNANNAATDAWAAVEAIENSGSGIQAALDNKVDKVSGKGLSTNDYTTTEKNKLSGIETGAQKNQSLTAGDGIVLSKNPDAPTNIIISAEVNTVDSAFSTTSTNPVQNQVVTNYLNSYDRHKLVTFGAIGSAACAITLNNGDHNDVTNIMTNAGFTSRDSEYFAKAADGSIKVLKAGYYEIVFSGLYNAMNDAVGSRVKRLSIAKRTSAENATTYTNTAQLTFAERCLSWETQKVSWMFYLAANERISFLVQCEGSTASATSTFAYMGGYIRRLGA